MSVPLLRVITRLNIGGPAIQALSLTRALTTTYPTVLAAGRPAPREGELLDPGVPVVRVPLVRPLRPIKDVRAFRAVRRLIDETHAQIVHTHMAKAGVIGRLAADKSGRVVRTVHTFHGHVLEGYFSSPVERAFIAVERFLAAKTDALIAVSSEVRDSLLELGIGAPERFHVIPLGFDLSSFLSIDAPSSALRRELGIPASTPLIGTIGRLVPIKDLRTLLSAMPLLPAAHLAVLGDGDLRAHLERHAETLGIANRVSFLGWRTDIADALSDMDVVALTSRNEGTPVSLIEASAASIPVVATDVGGVRSVVLDGETGFVVPSGNPRAVASAIGRLMDDADLRRAFGQKGRSFVRDRFAMERLVGDVSDLYDSLMKDGRHHHHHH